MLINDDRVIKNYGKPVRWKTLQEFLKGSCRPKRWHMVLMIQESKLHESIQKKKYIIFSF